MVMKDLSRSLSAEPMTSLNGTSYQVQVRSAHALADLLKRTRRHLYEKVNEVQEKVVCCQHTLDQAKEQRQQAERQALKQGCLCRVSLSDAEALRELEEAIQALLELRNQGQMAR